MARKWSSIAAELGRRGGKKGGPARARKLKPSERSAIARKGAQATNRLRWGRKRKKADEAA